MEALTSFKLAVGLIIIKATGPGLITLTRHGGRTV
jgi:hypothetical protein